ncbi:pilus assembly protein [Alteromonas ponticola]|uniref:Pilus assembly protein n=1 Tax=Alteromonas aquimaris TaxID=2998417 RepID=A0ABT3P9B3_9ALTE|nr:TadE family protein [Alteromonas aquimaris]MCW8109357.1 pilus assembly protein [Alteromonas aquimaris]
MPKLPSFAKARGIAAIEFTLVAPFMLLLIFATAEFGRLLYQYNALTNIVRDASRYMSDKAMSDNTGIPKVSDKLKSDTTKLIIAGGTTNEGEMLPGLTTAAITYDLSGEIVTITVSYDWTPIFADALFSFYNNPAISLNFPMVVSYSMRAS